MAKTADPVVAEAAPVEALSSLDEKTVAAMIESAFKEKTPDLQKLIEKIATEVAQKEVAEALAHAKRWGRREIELNASGAAIASARI